MQKQCHGPGCSVTFDDSPTRPREYHSRACQQRAYRLRKELTALAELHAAYHTLGALIDHHLQSDVVPDAFRHVRIAWQEFGALARQHTNLFQQIERGRAFTVAAASVAGSRAGGPGSSLQAQGGNRIGDDSAALGGGE